MSIKVTVPNTSSDSVVFGSANTPTAAEVVGIDSGSSNGQLAFKTTAGGTSTERMRIDANGNVGIGTSSPTFSSGIGIQVKGAGDTNVRLSSGSYTGVDLIKGSDGLSYLWNRDNTSLLFGTNNTERMRIDSSGNVLVNTTSQLGSSILSVKAKASSDGLYVQGQGGGAGTGYAYVSVATTGFAGYFTTSSGVAGSIYCNGTSTAYATSSDYRLKENIAPMIGALEKIALLKPVTYKWKADGSDGQGFIAHELQAVVPDCVTGEKDAVDADGNSVYQGIDTSFLVATLTAAIQELKAELDTVKSELATLKGTV